VTGLLAVASLATVAVPSAAADTVHCGEVLHASTTLSNSLIGCSSDGLVVGASGITVDLNGHAVSGVGLATGIRNDGHDDVTIRNGSVINFDNGVILGPGTLRNAVTGLSLVKNEVASIALNSASGNNISHNSMSEYSDTGLHLTNGSSTNVIVGNSIGGGGSGEAFVIDSGSNDNWLEGNVVPVSGGHAVRVEGSTGTMVLANQLAGGADVAVQLTGAPDSVVQANTISGGGDAAVAFTSSTAGVVRFNAFGKTGDAGVILEAMSNSLVKGNTMSLSGDAGVVLRNGSSNVRVIDNTATNASDSGISIADGIGNVVRGNILSSNAGGIDLSGGSNNVVEFNAARSNLGLGVEIVGSAGNTVYGNTLEGNLTGGLWVDSGSVGNTVSGNSAQGNGGDGFSVNGMTSSVQSNLARQNGGWGIYAGPGVLDGGGNGGSGNAEPAQCYLISCTDGSAWQAPGRPPEPIDPLEIGLPTQTAVGPGSGWTPTGPVRSFRAPRRNVKRRKQLVVVKCKRRRAKRGHSARPRAKVLCRAPFRARRTSRRVSGKLMLRGKALARGGRKVRGGRRGTVVLRARRGPAAGHYQLVLQFRDARKRKSVVRQTVRVRY
jgi:parallel beta-helix repeat protein